SPARVDRRVSRGCGGRAPDPGCRACRTRCPAWRPRRGTRGVGGRWSASPGPLHADGREDGHIGHDLRGAVAVVVDDVFLVLLVVDVLHVEVDTEGPALEHEGSIHPQVEL